MKNLEKPTVSGSYLKDDVVFVLKDIGDSVKEQSTGEREQAIQSGVHYSEMLPVEYVPSDDYMRLFNESLLKDAQKVALLVGVTAEIALKAKGDALTLVSLARAGTPVGVLMYRYLKTRYNLHVPHYSISIIRGKGIDENALHYILKENKDTSLLFVDGWTGKGAISKVLKEALSLFNNKYATHISADLAVLADPGFCAEISATYEDFLIPSACLNSTVSGLVSRTFHRPDVIKETDFHGARFYSNLIDADRSLEYIETISQHFKSVYQQVDAIVKSRQTLVETNPSWEGLHSVQRISRLYGIADVNLIKPGIGETTRVLLRRVPWKILVHPQKYHLLGHVLQLAKEKNIEVEEYEQMSYSCCGLIKQVISVLNN
ncbi:hypothetical protein DMA11_19865 [Marinilabiliaceae bacterium JC017]|nr:hypothetical protein DMA11_19865 [Marinilabiliaceae bacterium JC017]